MTDKEKQLREEIAELKKQLEMSNKVYNDNLDYSHHIEGQLTKAKEIIKIAREAYIKSGIYTLNSEPVYKEEVARLYALFFDRAEAFLNSEVEK